MKKPDNIYVALQLEKDVISGEIQLCIQFDRSAPNFFADKTGISWSPTIEELDFVSEGFAMITDAKRQKNGKTGTTHSTHDEWDQQTDEKEILDRVLDKKIVRQ